MLQSAPLYAYIPAKDLGRARRFYEQKLGFKPSREIGGGVAYECANRTACFLYPTPNAGTSQGEPGLLASERHRTRSRGAEVLAASCSKTTICPGAKARAASLTAGGAKAAWFKDSEGNIMAVIQST